MDLPRSVMFVAMKSAVILSKVYSNFCLTILSEFSHCKVPARLQKLTGKNLCAFDFLSGELTKKTHTFNHSPRLS